MVAFLTLAASFVLVIPAGELVAEPMAPGALYARQLNPGFNPSSIPSSCVNTCETFSQTITGSCVQLSCLCTNAVATGFEQCLNCAAKAGITGLNQTVVDETLSGYVDACNESGFPVSISGVSGTGSGGASGTATGSAATTTQTSPGGSIGGSTKSSGAAGHSASFVGSVFAVAMAGLALV